MTFENNSVHAEKNTTIDLSRVHFVTQLFEAWERQKCTSLRQQRAPKGFIHESLDQLGRTFCRFQRDISGIAISDDHIGAAKRNIIALYEAGIIQPNIIGFQKFGSSPNGIDAFEFLRSNIQKRDSRIVFSVYGLCVGRAHNRKFDQLLSICIDIRANVQNDACAFGIRPAGCQCRPMHAWNTFQHKCRHRHQRAGIACRYSDARLAIANAFQCIVHAGSGSSLQCLGGLRIHGDVLVGVTYLTHGRDIRIGRKERTELLFISVKEDPDGKLLLRKLLKRAQNTTGCMIPSHRVDRKDQCI